MFATLVLAVPIAITWMIVTARVTLDSFAVGYVIGAALLLLIGVRSTQIRWRKLPDQVLALIIYSLTLCRDIWLSSVDVTRRVLDPELPMNPGILAVPTNDPNESEAVAAFSAHGITITPGELVVDFDGAQMMFVHCLDIDASSQNAPGGQAKRLKLLNRILGR